VGPNAVSMCSLPVKAPSSPTLQTLERRAGKKTPEKKKAYKKKVVAKKKAAGVPVPKSRKARAQARVKAGKPKATAKDKGRTPSAPHTKPKGSLSASKKARVDERKQNRQNSRVQKHAAVIAKAKQKQDMPPYLLDMNGKIAKHPDGKLVKPGKGDVSDKQWNKHTAKQAAKATRKVAWNTMTPAQQAAEQAKKQAAQAASRAAHASSNIKEKNRQKRITDKAAARKKTKADTMKHVNNAKAAYKNAVGLPTDRKEVYTSHKGNTYTGKDVRQAVFAQEFAKSKGGVGYNGFTGKAAANKDKLPKAFENRLNNDGSTPLPGVPSGPGMQEFPIYHNKQYGYNGLKPNPSDARIITKQNSAGHTELLGKVSHTAGSDDHKSF